jgi:hypothetical protein
MKKFLIKLLKNNGKYTSRLLQQTVTYFLFMGFVWFSM